MQYDLEIAGIHFFARSLDTQLLIEPPSLAYAPFIVMADNLSRKPSDICVTATAKNLPSASELKEIFRGGESWAMSKKDDEYYLILNPSLADGPECIARFSPGLAEATVYCGGINILDVNGNRMLRNPLTYPLDQLLIIYALASREGALFHASCVGVGGRGYLFAGKSGAGKSTISRLLALRGHEALSDDRVIIRKIGDSFRSFGTPWPGEMQVAMNQDLPLSGIFFLEQSLTNRIDEIARHEALERFLPVTSIPWYDADTMTDALAFLEKLVSAIPSYTLHFTPDQGAVDIVETFGKDVHLY